MANTVVWVDIPVVDLDRAMKFYAHVLGAELQRQEMFGMPFAVMPHADNGVSGCVYFSDTNKPSAQGPLIYLSVEGRLNNAVAEVDAQGGKVLQAKHDIGSYGFRAIILDSEGNRVALHSTVDS